MTLLQRDPELLKRFRRGDRDALNTVYEAYSTRLGVHCRKNLGTRPFDTVDVVHEVFLLAFSDEWRGAYRVESQYFSLLSGMAWKVMSGRNRLAARHQEWEPANEGEDEDSDPSRQAEAAEVVRRLFSSLTEEERVAVEMTMVDDRTQESAARRIGWDRNKVKRAVLKARKLLAEFAGFEEAKS
jgi:RNA polymerase sigma factor (sigma-70 family)